MTNKYLAKADGIAVQCSNREPAEGLPRLLKQSSGAV